MPYYLRLLNNPVIRQGRSNHAHGSKKRNTTKATSQQPVIEHVDVQFKLSCTTDLGDAYYDGDLSIDVHLLSSERSSESVASSSVTWRKGMRVLAETVQLRCIEESGFTEYWLYLEAQYDEKLLVGASQVAKGSNLTSSRLLTCSLPEIVSVLAPVSFPSCSASDEDINQHVLRRFNIPKIYSSEWNDRNLHSKVEYLELYVFEEMGESIARHVW